MRKVEFLKPTLEILDKSSSENSSYCKLNISPLERGYGDTIGNSLRRVLLSSLPGAAAVAISIEGVQHEFTPAEGIVEDVTEIILNVKNVVFTINKDLNEKGEYTNEDDIIRLELDVKVPSISEQTKAGVSEEDIVYLKTVTAGDINVDSLEQVTVVNKDQIIATVNQGHQLKMEIFIRNGVGYVSAEENKKFCKVNNNRVIGLLPIDSIFTPVTNCRYTVTKTRHEDTFDCDLVSIDVTTNGSIDASNAIALASRFLVQHFAVIEELNDQVKNRDFLATKEEVILDVQGEKKIEDLNLSVRSYNCLKRANINTIGDLTQKTAEDMLKVRNLGRKSLKEVLSKLEEHGLRLKTDAGILYEYIDGREADEDTSEPVTESEAE